LITHPADNNYPMKLPARLILFAVLSLMLAGLRLAAEGFQPTGSMKQARLFHTATLLNDGRVLVIGGIDPAKKATNPDTPIPALTGVEIYDPATGIWSEGAPLAESRCGHTATLLPNGEVFVAGGRSTYDGYLVNFLGHPGLAIASAAIYNPTRNDWRAVDPMKIGHVFHSATLLPDGRVLIAGGDADYGGFNGKPELFTYETEYFDPTSAAWSPGGPFSTYTFLQGQTGRFGQGVLLLPDHRLLLAGGREVVPHPWGSVVVDLKNAELFRTETGTWRPAATTPTNCFRPILHLLEDGTVLLVAGYPNFSIAARYDPVLDLWTSAPASAQVHQSACAASLADGRLLVAGGLAAGELANDSNPPQTSCEIFSPLTGQWNPAGPLKTGRANGTLTRLQDGRILAAGGSTEPTAELFVPDAKPRLSVRWSGGQPTLLLEDTAGQPTVIEHKESLDSTTWSVLATFPHPDATQTVSGLPATARFFRARRTD
jgi:hypothetical protein